MVKLVCLDRDGTINEDNNYYLGSSPSWKAQVKLLEGVVKGIRKLNSLPETEVFIVTNQAGVAYAEPKFAELTEERMHEVTKYIINLLASQGARVRGYFACPFVDTKYVEKVKAKGMRINSKYVRDGHPDLKPNTGMLEKCAKNLGYSLKEVDLYVIGDRASDVELGLNGKGKGILVSSQKTVELEDVDKVKRLQEKNPGRVFIAKNFLEAVNYVETH